MVRGISNLTYQFFFDYIHHFLLQFARRSNYFGDFAQGTVVSVKIKKVSFKIPK
jgi:hypothetical protein